MRLVSIAALAAALVSFAPMSAEALGAVPTDGVPTVEQDPYGWLAAPDAPKALDWVKAENARSLGVLQADPRYAGFEADALKLVTAKDRLAMPSFAGDHLSIFWQDETHVQGLWRRTSLESYRSADPQWETLIDFDALSK